MLAYDIELYKDHKLYPFIKSQMLLVNRLITEFLNTPMKNRKPFPAERIAGLLQSIYTMMVAMLDLDHLALDDQEIRACRIFAYYRRSLYIAGYEIVLMITRIKELNTDRNVTHAILPSWITPYCRICASDLAGLLEYQTHDLHETSGSEAEKITEHYSQRSIDEAVKRFKKAIRMNGVLTSWKTLIGEAVKADIWRGTFRQFGYAFLQTQSMARVVRISLQ